MFSIQEVAYAMLETDGSISVLKKYRYSKVTNRDFNQLIIIDGTLDKANLKRAGLSEEWLRCELRKRHIPKIKNVFFCEWNKNEGLFIEKM
ncbi:YetF domain-containing protein [Sporolactobacillus terrae]|uniref:YetF domain-containing protein n=1 Tax=Sporolactobacillus terrae TaxID=269673 RepID=UPI0022AFB13A|nr:YetF domain-containing protein [Sporolactobacillus terrae]